MRVVLLAATLLYSVTALADHQPNILLLVAEDLSPRVGAYGDRVAHTPNIDALARSSIQYTQAFTTAGVCAPSRAALMMGLHQISFGAQHMRTSTSPLGTYLAKPPAHLKAFPEVLRENGYYTYTDTKLDYQFSGIRAGSGPISMWDADGASDTGWRKAAPGQPFFGMINFMETHESGVMRAQGKAHSPGHAQTQAFRQAAGLVAPQITNPAHMLLPPYYPDLPAVRADLARHYDNIAAMDQRVGRILTALIKDGLYDNTIVIWTSDHGDGLPRAKRELFDSGIHVPLLVSLPQTLRDPWLPTPRQDDRLVSFVDLGPTILQLAGTATSTQRHGRSIFDEPRQYIYASRDRIDEVIDRQRAIRTHQYKYIRSWYPHVPGGHTLNYRDNLDMVRAMRDAYQAGTLNAAAARWFEPAGDEQLYDLQVDPHELNNLADDPEFAQIKQTLDDALDRFLDRVGDTAETPEEQMRTALLNDGEIPITPRPTFHMDDQLLSIVPPAGASGVYRSQGEHHWQLYVQPIAVGPGQSIEAQAVRYGWKASPIATFPTP